MPAPSLIRDSFVGQIVYIASGRRIFRYVEEEPGYVLPDQYGRLLRGDAAQTEPVGAENSNSETATLAGRNSPELQNDEKNQQVAAGNTDPEKGDHYQVDQRTVPIDNPNPFIVHWYGDNDPDHPRNVRSPFNLITQ